VRLPKGWSRFGTGVLGGSRKNVAFRCVFQYGFEGETAGANPALGTTTEGAGGGAIDVSASNPETGLNSLDLNQPAAATGTTSWKSPAFQVACGRCIAKISVYTHSSMAGVSTIEGPGIALLDAGGTVFTDEGPFLAFRTPDSGSTYVFQMYDGVAWQALTTNTAYVASTRYDIIMVYNAANDLTLVAINGIIKANAQDDVWHDNSEASYISVEAGSSIDGRILVDNLIVCNLDVNTVAKSLSGGWADLDDASLATPSETPAANYRIPVIDLPAGVVY